MKTLLVLAAAGGLTWYGVAPERKATAIPDRSTPVRTSPAAVSEPPPEDPFAFILAQPGPPAPFDTSRPVVVRIPAGYLPFPAGDHWLRSNGAGVWHGAGGFDWTFSVVQHIHTTGRHVMLHVVSYAPGVHPTLPGQPNAFADSRYIGADGIAPVGAFAIGNPAGFATRFPGNGGAWLVFQP